MFSQCWRYQKASYFYDYFNVIIDLSTIDHINPNDLDRVFSEYERVLKHRGVLLLFAWFDINNLNVYSLNTSKDKPYYNQYFFNKE